MVSKTDLIFYYTNIEPYSVQLNPSQSIGGYLSDTSYGSSSALVSTVSVDEEEIITSSALLGAKLLVDDEIVTVQGNGAEHTVLERGALSTSARPHVAGVPVYSIPSQSLFNNALSAGRSQYRCLAVKNTNRTDTFYNLSFYFKEQSLTPYTTIQMAVEIPKTEFYEGSVGSGSLISIVDNGLGGFADNWFTNSVVKITGGLNINSRRKVISFDRATKTLVLDSTLPFAAIAGDTYEIQQSPSQTIASGSISPVFGSGRATALAAAVGRSASISINVTGSRTHGSDLAPNEVVYLWMSRHRASNAPSKINNRVVFSANYGTSPLS